MSTLEINSEHLNAASNKDAILGAWKEAKVIFERAQTEERRLRALVIETRSLITDENHSGTETVDIGWGTDLKIIHTLDYKLDLEGDCAKVHAAIEEFEKIGNEGGFISDRLFKQKFEIAVREYKLLDPKYKVIVDKILTIKPSSKSIEIKTRK